MRRAVTATFVTLVGAGLLFAYKPNPQRLGLAAIPQAAPTSSPSNGGDATAPPAPAPSATTTPGAGAGSGTFTGSDVPTEYGDVQVKAVVSGGRVVDVQAIRLPNFHARSMELSQYAAPTLRQEAIQAQSAGIDAVSGATTTSEAYIESLTSALQQAHLG